SGGDRVARQEPLPGRADPLPLRARARLVLARLERPGSADDVDGDELLRRPADAVTDIVRHRLVIPLDGRAVNLADVASADPMRLVLTGTVSSTIDGSLIDAFGRDLASARYDDGPYVLLPPGARVVESDATRHRYVV